MRKEVIDRIFKTKLAMKIWLYMLIPTLAVLLFIDISLTIYFNSYTLANSISNANNDTAYVASSFADTYTDLMKRVVLKTASADFRTTMKTILGCNESDYTQVNNELQELFTEYAQMNNLVKSVMIARVNGTSDNSMMFYSYYCHLMRGVKTYDLGFDLPITSGITILPHTDRPFTNQSEVLPVVIPLKYLPYEKMVLMPDQLRDADVILYLFLDCAEIRNFLELYCKDYSQGVLYFTDATGSNMSLPTNMAGASTANDSSISSSIRHAISEGENYLTLGKRHIFVRQVKDINLYLVNIVPHELFTAKSDTIHAALLWIAIASILLITCISLMISILVTRPLIKLMGSVHAIEANTYCGMADIRTKDEIGQLNQSINSMYNTIQQQFLTIKQKEKEKYNAKMQLLSEQMNPHFLYNALEFINMEVFSQHTENASRMISSLGDYLRTSLAYGETQLSIAQEIEQVMAYVNIMNFRFNNSIQLTTQVPEQLLNRKLLKCILQPLVENSLKHGFKLGNSNLLPILPRIDISFVLENHYLTLTVTDNGAGIDIEKATQIMQNKHPNGSNDRHMGLNNIYQRLTAFYQDVRIEFSTLPFYENKVIIQLPASFFE